MFTIWRPCYATSFNLQVFDAQLLGVDDICTLEEVNKAWFFMTEFWEMFFVATKQPDMNKFINQLMLTVAFL